MSNASMQRCGPPLMLMHVALWVGMQNCDFFATGGCDRTGPYAKRLGELGPGPLPEGDTCRDAGGRRWDIVRNMGATSTPSTTSACFQRGSGIYQRHACNGKCFRKGCVKRWVDRT